MRGSSSPYGMICRTSMIGTGSPCVTIAFSAGEGQSARRAVGAAGFLTVLFPSGRDDGGSPEAASFLMSMMRKTSALPMGPPDETARHFHERGRNRQKVVVVEDAVVERRARGG